MCVCVHMRARLFHIEHKFGSFCARLFQSLQEVMSDGVPFYDCPIIFCPIVMYLIKPNLASNKYIT